MTAPGSFTDTWYGFQSHPCMFFLGELARRAAEQRPDTVETLVQGLDQLAREWSHAAQERKPGTWNAHGFSVNDMPYARAAAQLTVHELARLRDPRAVPILISLAERFRDPRFGATPLRRWVRRARRDPGPRWKRWPARIKTPTCARLPSRPSRTRCRAPDPVT